MIFMRLERMQAKGVSCGVCAPRVHMCPNSWLLPVRNVEETLPAGTPMPSSDEDFVSFHVIPNEMNNH
jgi:hypothetical protein